MKFLQLFRNRRRQISTTASDGVKQKMGKQEQRRRQHQQGDATTVTTGDETSSTAELSQRGDEQATTTYKSTLPVWSAERFLSDGPLQNQDWWEDGNECDGDDIDEDNSSCDSSERDEEHRVGAEMELRPSSSSSSALHKEKEGEENHMYSGQRFVNRGYELWSLSRHAWVTAATVADDKSATTTKTTALVKSPPIPAAFRKELIKCLADRRQFELSQRIALSCVIDAYQQVWQNGALD